MTILTASSSSPPTEKICTHVETVHSKENVPGQTEFLEKHGLRTDSEDQDHSLEHEPRVHRSLPINISCSTDKAPHS